MGIFICVSFALQQTAGLQQAAHWNTVKDFRWHKTTHSPNWYEITPDALPTPPHTEVLSSGGTVESKVEESAAPTEVVSAVAPAVVDDDDDEM